MTLLEVAQSCWNDAIPGPTTFRLSRTESSWVDSVSPNPKELVLICLDVSSMANLAMLDLYSEWFVKLEGDPSSASRLPLCTSRADS